MGQQSNRPVRYDFEWPDMILSDLERSHTRLTIQMLYVVQTASGLAGLAKG